MRLAILLSGGGTTAEAIIKACQKDDLQIKPKVIISSRPDAGGIQKAKNLGIKNIFVVQRKKFVNAEDFGNKILQILKNHQVDLVSQNGWLPLTPTNVIKVYQDRIINQHPGPLDPPHQDFGGQGMYGARVTAAVLAYRTMTNQDFWTESTIHHVSEEYDKGDLIRVARLPIPRSSLEKQKLVETTQEVQKKLLPIEHQNVIAVLKSFNQNKSLSFKREKLLILEKNKEILVKAKKLAIEMFPSG